MARQSSFKNMVLTLTIVCAVTSLALAVVYSLTKDAKAAANAAKINDAIAGVLPEFDNNPSDEVFTVTLDGKDIKVYPGKKGGNTIGYAVESSTSKGFGGTIVLMVGFESDGKIFNTSVISHAETPGLGDKMDKSKSDFSLQFNGKNPADFKLSVKKDGGDVDAITASTITSRAFCDAVETAYKVFVKIEEEKL